MKIFRVGTFLVPVKMIIEGLAQKEILICFIPSHCFDGNDWLAQVASKGINMRHKLFIKNCILEVERTRSHVIFIIYFF